jgi:hypothetical protein
VFFQEHASNLIPILIEFIRILMNLTVAVPKSSKSVNYQRVPPLVDEFMHKSIGKTRGKLFTNAKISHSDAVVMHNPVIAFRHSFLTHSAYPVKPHLQNHHFVKDLR